MYKRVIQRVFKVFLEGTVHCTLFSITDFKEEIMDFTTLTIDILKMLSIVGGYGIGIILLTIIIRLAMWPLGVSQQRSMRTMQMLQPKMKAIQERYKSDPQKMQQKMMEFYKENNFKFNNMATKIRRCLYVGLGGYYWSSTATDFDAASYIFFDASKVSVYNVNRCNSFSVRLVR